MIPTWNGKPGKLGKHFQVWEFYPKYWKSEGIAGKRGNFTQNTGKGGNFSQFFIFLWFVIEVYWLNRFLYLLNS